jgi:hypothetical protein
MVLTEVLLGLAVLAAWLGAAGFARLALPLDRLHCVSFVSITCGALILAAAALGGVAPEVIIKVALLLGGLLLGGAATAHSSARAIVRRRARG